MPPESSHKKTVKGLWANLPGILKQLTALVGAVGTIVAGYLAYKMTETKPVTAAPTTAMVTAALSTAAPVTADVFDPPDLPYDGGPALWCYRHRPSDGHLHCRLDPTECLDAAHAACDREVVTFLVKGKPGYIEAKSDCVPQEDLLTAMTSDAPTDWIPCP